MIAIIDYGAGNIKSLQFALTKLGYESYLTTDQGEIRNSNAIILPGVGAFEDAMTALHKADLVEVIKDEANNEKPLLGICLGMQLLYETSNEDGLSNGLGLLNGHIERINNCVKVPHMGWNTLSLHRDSTITYQLPSEAYVYFVHSYFATNINESELISSTNYGGLIPAIVRKNNIIGMQFHPEKSGSTGLQLLKNFGEMIS
ncbi:imidazole glycerol phosphate synthase subunit HisH [Ornithinibacillus sp. L9]|uniref:Imidazole glycerol phosphate synthase subunit HisH n=1 Tax=Ornithinibacillus caprae TaxID=2678566 RepID=A0A6N8FM45_9BACI|nr:imidazole glycerol phosphate synthase subunit HisH [Ornithinibacillus caprae]MUK89796.1 imidazole glycerol phosphate synthase subunit HisH [Ornithinibacillus caprae]